MAKTSDPLTPRQREITDMFLSGKTYKEVASHFGISPETVNPTLKAVRAKLGATGISREALKAAQAK